MTPSLRLAFGLAAILPGLTGTVRGAQAQPAAAGPLAPAQLAIVINDAEPNSVAIGEYYRRKARHPGRERGSRPDCRQAARDQRRAASSCSRKRSMAS